MIKSIIDYNIINIKQEQLLKFNLKKYFNLIDIFDTIHNNQELNFLQTSIIKNTKNRYILSKKIDKNIITLFNKFQKYIDNDKYLLIKTKLEVNTVYLVIYYLTIEINILLGLFNEGHINKTIFLYYIKYVKYIYIY